MSSERTHGQVPLQPENGVPGVAKPGVELRTLLPTFGEGWGDPPGDDLGHQ